MDGLELSTEIARAVASEPDQRRVLALIAERSRALLGARGALVLLREGSGLTVAAAAGDVPAAPVDGLGMNPATTRIAPLVFRGESLGLLALLEPSPLDREHELLLAGLAAAAATSAAATRRVDADRLRAVVRGAEEERRRWARELHDETLQGLGALRLVLAAGRRGHDPDGLRAAVDDALEQLDQQVDALRSLIRELRPASLEELGASSAIDDLASRTAARHGVTVTADIGLDARRRHPLELEIVLYRVIQEALDNAVRHAGGEHVDVSVHESGGSITARVADDGRGFDPARPGGGYGLGGMREWVSLLDGALEVASSEAGTVVTAVLPA